MLYLGILLFVFSVVVFFLWPQSGIYFFLFLYILVPALDVYGFFALRMLILAVLCCSAIYRLLLVRGALIFAPNFKRLLTFMIIFIVVALTIDLYQGLLYSHLNVILKTLARVLMPLLILFVVPASVVKEKDVFRLIIVMVFFSAISSVVAILQFCDVQLAWKLRTIQGEGLLLLGNRPPGLSVQAVTFSYLLALAYPLSATLFLTAKVKQFYRAVFFVFFIVIAGAVVMTMTRSLILGCLLSTIFIFYKLRKYKTLLVIVCFCLIAGVSLQSARFSGKISRISTVSDGSAQGRLPLAITAIMVSLDHPLGVGSFSDKYLHVVNSDRKYVNYVSGYNFSYGVLNSNCHNHFLNVLVYWGWLALLCSLIIVFMCYRLCESLGDNGFFSFDYSKAFRAAILAYVVNCLFHNGGPFLGGYLFWFLPAVANVLIYVKEAGSEV